MHNINDLSKNAPQLHKKILELLDNEKRGYLLDAPAGTGKLSYYISKKGFNVLAADIDEKVFKIPEIKFRRFDLNKRLPCDDSSFDYIVCAEGIEHIESFYPFLWEFSRIIKHGGKLIISTPNILSIFSRLRYFLIGYYDFFGGYYSDENNFYTLHISPVGFPQLYSALKKVGFKLEFITTNRSVLSFRNLSVKLLLWFLATIVKKITAIKVKDKFMRRILSSPELLMGEILILKCIKA